jgi:hypothetical protein
MLQQDRQLVEAIRTVVHQNGRHYSVRDVRKRFKDGVRNGQVTEDVRQAMEALYNGMRHENTGPVGNHLAVALDDYPGLVGMFQDSELRRFLAHDTGQGLLFVRKEALPYLPLARSSPVTHEVMDARAGLDVFRRMAVEKDYDYSLRGMFHKYVQALPAEVVVQADARFDEIEQRLKKARLEDFCALSIKVEEYEAMRLDFWRTLAELTVYAIEFLSSAVGRFQDLTREQRKDVRRALLVCASSMASLKTLAEVYAAPEAHRFDYAIIYVQETALGPAFAV